MPRVTTLLRARGPAVAALVAAAVLAGCGSDDKSSGTTQATKPAPPTSQSATAVANLQLAASDVVRETSYKDKDGSQRAYDSFTQLFASTRAAIQAKGAELASKIEEESAAVGRALKRGDLAEASREAKALQKAVNSAATVITGQKAGTKQGLLAVLGQMRAAARDLNEEAKNKDAPGTQRAYQAFAKLFASSQRQLAAKDPGAVETIKTGLEKVQQAIEGKDDTAKIQATTGDLLTAVNAIAAKTK